MQLYLDVLIASLYLCTYLFGSLRASSLWGGGREGERGAKWRLLFIYAVGSLTFKCVKGLAPRYLCSRFVTRATVHDRDARNKNKLDISGYKSATG